MLKPSSRVGNLKSSTIMEISNKAAELKAQGLDVISLAAGEPDFNTPEPIQQAATQAMHDGITRYTPSPGFLALREAIAHKVEKENKLQVTPEEIIVTSGAKHAIFMALQCIIEPGDMVLVPTPMWVSYTPMIEYSGATIFPLPLFEEDGYRPNVDRWKGMAIPPNAKGIILNSPNNPTGAVYSEADLIRLVGWAMQRNLWIISDEIYEKILYDGVKHVSVASLGPEVKNHTITISGFSKSCCMTGWRLGWAIADKDFIKKMSALQSQSTSHVTSFVQWAGIAAAKLPDTYINTMVDAFKKRRDYCMERMDKLSGALTYSRPEGAFYFFINLAKWLTPRKMNDLDFCRDLLAKHHVGVVPGSAFGKEKSIRISYATSQANLEKSFDRIEACLNS
jgi:aspartate aminotransferase